MSAGQICVEHTADGRTDGRADRHGGLRGGRLQREIIMERQTRGRRRLPARRDIYMFTVLFDVIVHSNSTAGGSEVFCGVKVSTCCAGLNPAQFDRASFPN